MAKELPAAVESWGPFVGSFALSCKAATSSECRSNATSLAGKSLAGGSIKSPPCHVHQAQCPMPHIPSTLRPGRKRLRLRQLQSPRLPHAARGRLYEASTAAAVSLSLPAGVKPPYCPLGACCPLRPVVCVVCINVCLCVCAYV